MLEFPRTLDDILVWKLVNSDLKVDGFDDSYFAYLWRQHGAQYSNEELQHVIFKWLKTIVHLDGIVKYEPVVHGRALGFWTTRTHDVSVAGVSVTQLSNDEVSELSLTVNPVS